MPNGNGHTKFGPGAVAETIILAGPGEEVPSTFEPFKQMRYMLADGRVWYAPLKTGTKINKLDLKPGEAFRVCKRPFGRGSVIDVQRCTGTEPTAIDEVATVLAAQLKASIEAAKNKPTEQPAQPLAGKPAAPQTAPLRGAEHTNGTAFPVNGQGENGVDLAMKAAIDVCARGQKYAEAKGLHILFVGEDVRTIMNTILIGQQKAMVGRY